MAQMVRAAVRTGIETTEIQEFPRPETSEVSGLLRLESCGVGGSDPELYRRNARFPAIMGHELVGIIEEAGAVALKTWGVKIGDRVALQEYLPCMHCKWCKQGDYRLCVEVDFFVVKDPLRYGMGEISIPPSLWGGNAHYAYMPLNAIVHKVPPKVSAREATLTVPFGNGVQWAVLDGGAGPGKTVLVFGPGQQGLGCTLAAKACGALTVILVGQTRDRARLDLGLRLGADYAIDVDKEDLKTRVTELVGERGIDVVVDTTGDPTGQIAEDAVALAAKGAYLNLNGLSQKVSVGDIKKWYLTVRAPRGRSYRAAEMALAIIATGRWPTEEVCSHDFDLDKVDLAIKATAGKVIAGAIHVTVDPWKETGKKG